MALFVLPVHSAQAQRITSTKQLNPDYVRGDVDVQNIGKSRDSNSSLRTKIKRLDNDVVDDLVIPILFGVALDDITENFGDPRGGGTRSHEGLDMLAPRGTPVISPTEAVVLRVGVGPSSGKYVSTANPGDETFVYMHLDEAANLRAGDTLRKGEVIGFVGDTGNAKGGTPHLHFEVRDGRRALDPYNRVTKAYTLKEKSRLLDHILDEYDDERDLAKFMVREFEPVFIQMQLKGVAVPREIERLLADVADITSASARDLEVGAKGSDVSVLQTVLIQSGHLDIETPTGYFGPLTRKALRDYQSKNGISPATGYYGKVTRAYMQRGTTAEPKRVAARVDGELSLATLVQLFLALDIIPADKAEEAYAAIEAMGRA